MSFADGIHLIDTGFQRPHFDAAYLIVANGRGAFIDCGPPLALPALLTALAEAGLAPAAVDWLILTHVHLDHAGGAGGLLRALPSARLHVHRRGAPHMIDPARLIAGASAVYGEAEMARSYGQIEPVPAERVVLAEDGQTLSLGGRALHCIDSPGHARHHQCVWDERSRCWFSGDAFGVSYRELDNEAGQALVIPSSSPVQFEPEAMHASIERLLSYRPQAMYLTHYGRVEQVERLAESLHRQIEAMVAIARRWAGHTERYQAIAADLTTLYHEHARAHGCRLDEAGLRALLAGDVELNAQGLECWLERETGKPTG